MFSGMGKGGKGGARGGSKLHMVPVPKMGNNASGVLIEHCKLPGAKVKKGETICYVEYGKFTDEFKSPVDGTVQSWCVPEEGNVRPGADLVAIEVGGDDAAATSLFFGGGFDPAADHLANAAAELQRQAEKRAQTMASNTMLAATLGNAMSMGSAMAGLQRPLGLPTLPSALASSLPSALASSLPSSFQAQTGIKLPSGLSSGLSTTSGNLFGAPNRESSAASSGASSASHVTKRPAPEKELEPPAKPVKQEPTHTPEELEKLKCHLHKKANKKCKFCERYTAAKAKNDEELSAKKKAISQAIAQEMTFNCSPLLKEQVVNCSYYKSLMLIENVDDLVQEIKQFASDSVDVYRNSMDPSPFMCCVYRLFTFNLPEDELRWVIDNPESVYVRCVAFLYFRFVVPPNQLWDKVEEFVLDDAPITMTEMNGQIVTKTIGEYIEDLLLKEKYYGTPLPRLPAAVRIKLEEALAPMAQYRKRGDANKKKFTRKRASEFNMNVEVHDGGEWKPGRGVKLVDACPSRLQLHVKLEDGRDVISHIGKILMNEEEAARTRSSSRSRSPGRGQRTNSPDWSRNRGKSDAQLIQELRERSRDEAVCSNRKDYARRLPRFESGLAIRREKGSAEAKLIEEETFITPGMRLRPEYAGYAQYPGVEEEEESVWYSMKRRQQEEEDERKRMMKDIYEKYGSGSSKVYGNQQKQNDFEGPDTMRLG